MKKLISFILIISTFMFLHKINFLLLKVSNTIKPDIEKVTSDYYDHFYNIKGEQTF